MYRPVIKHLYSLVEAKKVLISEVTRLGRRTRELLEVIDYLHEQKVSLVVHNYRMETLGQRSPTNSMTQFLITILAESLLFMSHKSREYLSVRYSRIITKTPLTLLLGASCKSG